MYRYRPGSHRLEAVSDGDVRRPLAAAALDQQWMSRAALVVVIAAAFERTTARYGKRGERYVHMEAGHAAQNLLLEATALGLGATPVGAFDAAEVCRLLRLPDGETPLPGSYWGQQHRNAKPGSDTADNQNSMLEQVPQPRGAKSMLPPLALQASLLCICLHSLQINQ